MEKISDKKINLVDYQIILEKIRNYCKKYFEKWAKIKSKSQCLNGK